MYQRTYQQRTEEPRADHHSFRVAVLAKDLVEATLEFDSEIEPSDEDDSMSRDRPMYTGGSKTMLAQRLPSILPPLGGVPRSEHEESLGRVPLHRFAARG